MTYALSPEFLAAKPHIFPHAVDGEEVYVKKGRSGRNPVGKFFQRILYRLTGNALILPPLQPEAGSTDHEVAVLRRLAGHGMNVPRVLHHGDGYFVMESVGPTLERVIRDNPGEKMYYIERAARELRRLHDLGLAHGGSQAKNMLVRDGAVYFIDFEERIPPDRVEAFQLRDFFLFLFSLERSGADPDLAGVCRAYGGDRADEVLGRMRGLIRGLGAVKIVDNPLFGALKLRDIRAIGALVRKCEGAATPS